MVPGLNRCTLRFVYFLEELSSSQSVTFVCLSAFWLFAHFHPPILSSGELLLIDIHPRRLRDFLLFIVQMRL